MLRTVSHFKFFCVNSTNFKYTFVVAIAMSFVSLEILVTLT